MYDNIFDKMEYEEFIGWNGSVTLAFGSRKFVLQVIVHVDEDKYEEITLAQRQAFTAFTEKWDSIEPLLVEALIQYYNNEEKYSYGPDNEEETALWWPDINTHEELVNSVTPDSLIIPPDYLMETGRRVYLLFDRAWGGEDLDDNGIGVCFINEQMAEIGSKDIAF